MKGLFVAAIAAIMSGAIFFAPPSNAHSQDDVLCSSNMAYRNAHKGECKDIGINSHGGGGGWDSKDFDRDGTPNGDDPEPRNPVIR